MLLVALLACSGTSSEEPIVSPGTPYVATLREGQVDGVATTGIDVVAAWESAWIWLSPIEIPLEVPAPTHKLQGAATVSGERIVLAEQMWALGGSAPVDLELLPVLPGVPQAMCDDGDLVWIGTDGGLVVWNGSTVFDVRVDGAPVTGPLACGGMRFGEQVAWVGVGERVTAIAGAPDRIAAFDTAVFNAEVQSVAVTSQGDAWLVTENLLFRHTADEGWVDQRLPALAFEVLGGPQATGVWITSDRGLWWANGDGGFVEPTSGPGTDTEAIGGWQADALGRLLVRDEAGLHRLAMNRPLWLNAPPSGAVVAEPTAITVVPTAPEEISALSLELVEEGLTLELTEGTAVLDPGAVSPGSHTLRATAEYASGPVIEERTLELLPLGAITWSDHIAPLHEDSCAVCHTGSTETILDGAAAWAAEIDRILENVESGAMPLGGPPLEAGTIALIRAWRDGDFPP